MGAINTLSSVLPILGGVATTVQTLEQTLGSFINFGESSAENEQELALQQLQDRQNLQQTQLAEQAVLDQEKLSLQAAQDEEDRRQALRRAVARQRALFGVQGVSGSGGSSEAVLLGLFEESKDELAQRESLDNIRSRAIDLNVSQQSSLNLLQATQLAERQNLQKLF